MPKPHVTSVMTDRARHGLVSLMLGTMAIAASCAPHTSSGYDPEPGAPTASCLQFADALRACAPASCGQPHPLVSGFTIEHRVVGQQAGGCAYTQSMPGDMVMSCRLSESGRSEIASQLEDTLSGRRQSFSFRFSTADPPQDNTMTRECILRDRSGTIIPWGESGG